MTRICLASMAIMAGGAVVPIVLADTIMVPGDQPTIQAGIDAAVDGDVVVVADGVYTGDGNRDMNFGGRAITVRSENGAAACIIDLQADENDPHRAFTFDGGGIVNSVVEGFTIENGFTTFNGGAVLCSWSSAQFRRCIFRHNTATNSGGAVSLTATNATFIGCQFLENHAVGYPQNWGSVAGGGGAGPGTGGAMSVTHVGSVDLVNCTFAGNQAAHGGGALYHDPFIGGHVYADNSILWNNSPDEIASGSDSVTVRYSDVQGGWDGEGNINADPLFVAPESGDLRLSAGSPCLDAGDNTAGPGQVDLDGNPRFVHDPCAADTGVPGGMNPPVDMGAYEFQPPCRTDLDCNGDVGAVDLLALLGAWGSCAGCPEDVDNNGDVGLADLLIVLAAWGDCEGFADSDRDGVPDAYDNCPDTPNPLQEDCDGAGTGDACDSDCNDNGTLDGCDIADMVSDDCNGNGIPDECEPDCNDNGIPDECDSDCNNNGIPDECEEGEDCNNNGIPDECEGDCNGNGIPDECEPDCNDNGIPDECEVGAPSNDACEEALLIINQNPACFSTFNATTDGLMEPTECSANGDDDVQSDIWFRGFAICTGTITFTLSDLDYPARMAIYFDLSCPAGPDEAAACVQAPGETSITLPVDIGQGLHIRIGGEHGAQGTGTLTVECTAEAPQ